MKRCVACGVSIALLSACSDPPRSPRVFAEIPIDQVDRYPVPPPRLDPAAGATEEQLARRARSIVRLRAQGVPVMEELPVIETAAECRFRTRDEIVDRAVALLVVASRGAGDPPDYVTELASRFGTSRLYSPIERAFMADPAPSQEQLGALSWRFESLLVLLWALGYRNSLPGPSAPTDGVPIAEIIRSRTPDELRAGARVRSPAEILDQADLVYRYHWATTDAWIAGRPPPAGVSPDVIMEWHHALNWLIGYQGAAWDDVPTDT